MNENIDAIVLRQIFMQQFALGLGERVRKSYDPADRSLLSFIREWADDASDKDLQSLLTANKRNKRVKELFDKIGDVEARQILKTSKFMLKEMTALAIDEAVTTADALGDASLAKKINPEKMAKHPVLGIGLATEWKSLNNKWYDHVRATLINTAQESGDLAKSIKGTRDQNYKDGVVIVRNNTIERVAETRVNGLVTNVRGDVYTAAGVEMEDYLATLDHRTCLICADAEINGPYPRGRGKIPPLHPRCRCIRVPAGNENIERPYVEDHRSVKDIPKDQRGTKIGTGIFDYAKFFERQTDAAKMRILGKARFDLYKSGDFEITDFVHDKSQRIYSLDDLNRQP